MFCLQNRFFNSALIFLLFLIVSNTTVAGTSASKPAKKQVIDIKANYLLLDEAKGISKYQGEVVFTKETLIIQADTVELFYTGEKLSRALITGSPADVQHQPDNEDKVHSQAKVMEFFVNEDRLTLKGNAIVDQGNRHFSGEYIEYDTRQRTITAAGKQQNINDKTSKDFTNNSLPTSPAGSRTGRVHVIIGPDENTENKEQ